MKKYFLFTLLVTLTHLVNAQTWDAGGDQTSWDDALNWDNDLVPSAGDVVTFDIGGTVVLTTQNPVTNFPSRVLVTTGTNLDIDLDLTIGDGTIAEHALKGQASTTITIKANRTLTINTATDKDGIQNNASSNGTVTIEPSATVDILQARDGATITAGNTLNVNGTLNISGANRDGIVSLGTLTNAGSITVNPSGDDGIEISGGNFVNDGTVNVTRNNSGAGGEYAMDIISTDVAVTNNGIMNIDGGTNTSSNNATALSIGSAGTLVNTGNLSLSGGVAPRVMLLDGILINDALAVFDLNDRRARVISGTLTNNGLMLSTYGAAALFRPSGETGTADNFAFYDFGGSSWSNFGGDTGTNLQDVADTQIDMGGGCTVNVTQVATSWTYPGSGMNDIIVLEDITDLTGADFLTDPVTLTLDDYTADYGDIEITLSNICAAALPIELLTFEVEKRDDKNVLLKWTTESEVNSDYIQVERSSDARQWKELGRVMAQGYSKELIDYDYLDNSASVGMNYYRLKLVDLDGQYEYSDIRQINQEGELGDISIFPTMISRGNMIDINVNGETDKVRISATNINGSVVRFGTYNTNGTIQISTDNLPSGMYLFSFDSNIGTKTQKVVITQ